MTAQSIDARTIANWFVKRGRKDGCIFTIMSLLKLVYIAHGWRLAEIGAPLFPNKIEAWQYGPVVVDVYEAFRKQGINTEHVAARWDAELPEDVAAQLEKVYADYAHKPAFELSRLTHEAGGPWEMARDLGGWYKRIPDNVIRQHYELKKLKTDQASV